MLRLEFFMRSEWSTIRMANESAWAVVSSRLSGNDICVVGVYTSGFKTTTSGKNISETQTAITGCRVQYLTWAQISTCSFLCTFGVFVFLSAFFNWFTQLFTPWIIPNPFTRVLASVTLLLLTSHRAAPFSPQKHPTFWLNLLAEQKAKGKVSWYALFASICRG